MYIVYTTYDDGYIDIMNIETRSVQRFTRAEAAKFGANHDVLGLSVSNDKINYAKTYRFIQFCDEYDMQEYIRENSIACKEFIGGYWHVFYKTNNNIHVEYVIWHYTENETVYLAEKGTTANLKYARSFDRDNAYKVCKQRNNALAKKYNMIECGYWTVRRVEN